MVLPMRKVMPAAKDQLYRCDKRSGGLRCAPDGLTQFGNRCPESSGCARRWIAKIAGVAFRRIGYRLQAPDPVG